MKCFSQKDAFVIQAALGLFAIGMRIEGYQMAKVLTLNGYYGDSGKPYDPIGRGKTTYFRGLSKRLKKAGRFYEAGAVENAFTKKSSKSLHWE